MSAGDVEILKVSTDNRNILDDCPFAQNSFQMLENQGLVLLVRMVKAGAERL